MSNTKGKIESTKDKLVGGVKEKVGKVTGNEKLELKGKIQTKKGELEGKAIEVVDQVEKTTADIAEKINDAIDKDK
ncbi:MAG: CsbD family protein [Acetobacterium sp.]|nr:CsbD family protein [Acetobacterium sp.]